MPQNAVFGHTQFWSKVLFILYSICFAISYSARIDVSAPTTVVKYGTFEVKSFQIEVQYVTLSCGRELSIYWQHSCIAVEYEQTLRGQFLYHCDHCIHQCKEFVLENLHLPQSCSNSTQRYTN